MSTPTFSTLVAQLQDAKSQIATRKVQGIAAVKSRAAAVGTLMRTTETGTPLTTAASTVVTQRAEAETHLRGLASSQRTRKATLASLKAAV